MITDLTPGDLVVVRAFYPEIDYHCDALVHPEAPGAPTTRLPDGTIGLLLKWDRRNLPKFRSAMRILVGDRIYQIAVHHLEVYDKSKQSK